MHDCHYYDKNEDETKLYGAVIIQGALTPCKKQPSREKSQQKWTTAKMGAQLKSRC